MQAAETAVRTIDAVKRSDYRGRRWRRAIMAQLAPGRPLSLRAMATALDVSATTLQPHVRTLAEAGRVEMIGAGPSSRWRLTDKGKTDLELIGD